MTRGMNHRNILPQDVPRYDQLRQLWRIEIIFDVVQRNRTDKATILRHVKIVESIRDELLPDLSKARRRRHGQRIGFHQVADMKFGKLLSVIACPFPPQGLAIDRTFEGFHTPTGRGRIKVPMVNQLLQRRGVITNERANDGLLGKHEWWLSDLADELQTPRSKLQEWALRGWVQGRKTPCKAAGSFGPTATNYDDCGR